MINLYWFNQKPNFGDELSPQLCEKISGQEIQYCKDFAKCDLVAIGSILEHVNFDQFQGQIWGSGFISLDSQIKPIQEKRISAVRGIFTKQKLGIKSHCVLGDPGLLADMLMNGRSEPRTQLGLIPHFVDSDNKKIKWIATNADNIKIIDITAGIDKVIQDVADCKFVAASCLHGLILADSLGIPNSWIKLSDRVLGNDFKFYDYYSVFNINKPKPITIQWWDNAKSICKKIRNYQRRGIQQIKTQLIDSFPMK